MRLLAFVLLGGCACQNAATISSKNPDTAIPSASIPAACSLAGQARGPVQPLTCEDGRQGFVIAEMD